MNLEDITMGEISPSKKDAYCRIPLIWYLEESNSWRQRGGWWLSRAAGGGDGEFAFNRYRGLIWKHENVPGMDGGHHHVTTCVYLIPLNGVLKNC